MSFDDFIDTVKCKIKKKNMCLILDIKLGVLIGLAVVALCLTKPIRFVIDLNHLFLSSIVRPFSFKSVLSLAVTIPFVIVITML